MRVFLASAGPEIASLPAEVTVEAGSSYVSVPLSVTLKPGAVHLSAVANGYEGDEIELQTFSRLGEISQSQEGQGNLSVTLAPSALLADGETHEVLYVQLLGPDGSPRQASAPVRVFLASAGPEIATLPAEVTVDEGSSFPCPSRLFSPAPP